MASAQDLPVSAIVINDSQGLYSSGDKIHPGDAIDLADGRELSLVFSDGQTKTLLGPYKSLGTGLSKKPSKLQQWKKLIANIVMRKGASDVIGGVRGLDDLELYRLDLQKISSGPICAANGLYVENTNSAKTITLKNPKSGISVNLPGKSVISWPNFFTDTGPYLVLGGAIGGQKLDVKIISDYSLDNLDKSGCQAQFDNLLPKFVEFALDLSEE
jgi:hypothetical protein